MNSTMRTEERGFTLIEILVAMTILSIVMTIIYSAFSTSISNAKIVEKRGDDISILTGAIDTLSSDFRGIYLYADDPAGGFYGKKGEITFTVMTTFAKDDEPVVQRVSYIFDSGRLIRRVLQQGLKNEVKIKSEFLLLEGIKGGAFSFFKGKEWVEQWPLSNSTPSGIRVSFSYNGREVQTVMPI